MARRSPGEGTVHHNLDRDRWEARLTVGHRPDGTLIRRKVTGKTRREVTGKLAAARKALDHDQPAREDRRTIEQWLTWWIDNVLPRSVAPTTLRQYADVARLYVVPYIGHRQLTKLQPRHVAEMLADLDRAGLAPNTQRLARSVLRRAIRRAEQDGIVDRNVAAIADGVRVKTTRGRTLTPDQARALLDSLDGHRLEAAYAVALSLGLRRGELLGLTWPDIDLEGEPGRLTVHQALKRLPGGLVLDETKTAGSRRTVHLPRPLVTILRSHRARQAADRLAAGDLWTALPLGSDLVFRTPFGTAVDPDNFRQATYRITEAAGIGRRSPHELRHSAASLLLAQGVPLKVVSETLGHASIRVTADVYGHLLEPARTEAAEAMGDVLWGQR